MAFGCFVLPAILFEALWLYFSNERWSIKVSIVRVLAVMLLTNTVCVLVSSHFFHRIDVIGRLESNIVFSTKYLVLSLLTVMVALYFGLKYCKGKKVVITLPSIRVKRSNVIARLLVAVFVFGILFFYCTRLVSNDFWADELYSIMRAGESVSEMLSTTAADVHPPLYYLILHETLKLFGKSPIVYQGVSFAFFVASILVCYISVWKRFGAKVAIPLILLFSLSSIGFRFSTEVRMYSMAMFFTLVAYISLYDVIIANKKSSFVALTVFSILAAYTHYYALLVVAIMYVGLLIYSLIEKGKMLKRTIFSSILALLAYLPWIAITISTINRTLGDFWITTIPSFSESVNYLFEGSCSSAFILLLLFSCIVFFIVNTGFINFHDVGKNTLCIKKGTLRLTKEGVWALIGVVAVLGTLILAILVSYAIRPIYQLKYLVVVAPVAWLLICYFCSRIPLSKLWCVVLCVMTVISGAMLIHQKMDIEKSNSESLENVLSATGDLGEKPRIFSDAGTFDLALLGEYYYAGVPRTWISSVDGAVFPKDLDNWLFMKEPLTDRSIEALSKEWEVEDVEAGVMGRGRNPVHVYRLSPILTEE